MILKRVEKEFALLDHLVPETIRFKRLFLRKFALNVLIRAKTHVQHDLLNANSVSRLASRLLVDLYKKSTRSRLTVLSRLPYSTE